jgi:transposase-like protein
MEERGVNVAHLTLNRRGIKYSPQLEEQFHRRQRRVWTSWRLDGTYIRVKGKWEYLYRAVDKVGKTIDFLLTEQRVEKAARKFLNKAMGRHGSVSEKIAIDGRTANEVAIKSDHEEQGTAIEIRKSTGYTNTPIFATQPL